MTDLRQAAQQALEAWDDPAGMKDLCVAMDAIRTALGQQQAEPVSETETEAFGFVTVRRLSQRFENHHDQYQFYPAGQIPYLDNVDECHTVYTAPLQRKPLTDELEAAFKEGWQSAKAAHGIKEWT